MNQSITSLPDINQPGVRQPGMSQLSRSQPDTNQQGMKQPGMWQSGPCQISTRQPGTWQQGRSQSIMTQPGTRQAGMRQSDLSQSSMSLPSLRQPSLSQSGTSQPGPSLSGISQTGRSQPGMWQPGPSQPHLSQPDMRQPGMRQPRGSQSGVRQSSLISFRVRPAEAQDCLEILRLIKELAACENMVDAVKLTAKDLLRDGFGENPLFYCLIAEVHTHQKPTSKVTVGFAMYYFTYDPWIGRLLYLEDFYVIQAYRGLGIGAEMLKRLSQIAIRSQCSCMHFLVVIWNQASIDYYTRRGALDLSSEKGWHLFRFNRGELMDMAGEE
ncbi:spermidine/spermine N(1)-acetyltransferase-like protein 1 [Vicugna pacos]|uniref:Spermidine/spermine N(1)-acetyltransferase-like protein 1 n=1 Tax=Vicugna pacos TaxID=30538 RepID=A0A6J3A1K1_VICPA